MHHSNIILPIEYIVLNTRHITNIFLIQNKMQGKNQQIPIFLAGIALIYLVGYSGAKYNIVVRDDEIAAMKVTVAKGISIQFRNFIQ